MDFDDERENIHTASIWDHSLSAKDAITLRNRPYPKLVIYGAYENVVMSMAGRQLAGRIRARAIPIQSAPFGMEEALGRVNELI